MPSSRRITQQLLLTAFVRCPGRCTGALAKIADGYIEDGLVELHELALAVFEFKWTDVNIDLIENVAVACTKGGTTLPDNEGSTYTRRQAIADGQLIDVTNLGRTVGLTAPSLPVAITDTAWAWLRGTRDRTPTRMQQRTLRVLHAARSAVLGRLSTLGRTPFTVHIGRSSAAFAIEIHESDEAELVVTIMADHKP